MKNNASTEGERKKKKKENIINQQSFSLRRKIAFICRHAVYIQHICRHSISIDWQQRGKEQENVSHPMIHMHIYIPKCERNQKNKKEKRTDSKITHNHIDHFGLTCAHTWTHSKLKTVSAIDMRFGWPKGVRNLYRCMNLIVAASLSLYHNVTRAVIRQFIV